MNLAFFIFSLLLVWISVGDGNNSVVRNDKKCMDNEKQALLEFKSLLQDPNESLSTWKAEDDCCEWSGVTCINQTGHVTTLDLGVSNLVGEISLSLFNLTYLTHLNLFANSFNGSVSESIGFLTELTYLDLSFNSFNGSIPRSIGSLTKLTYLDLGGNSFNGTIPNSIGSLIELRHLRFSYNYFLKGTIPSEFRNLANLQEFLLEDLTSCTIENIDWMSGMSELRDLNLDGTSLAKANNWVNVIINLQKLSFLSLSDCELSHVMHPYSSSSSSVNSSSSSSNISYLDLSNNNLNSSMYHWLFPLTSNTLVTLYLSGNMLDTVGTLLSVFVFIRMCRRVSM